MKILKKNTGDLEVVVDTLKNGGLVFLPTETVYIAAVDATNPDAVQKLIKFKNRPFGKPFSVGVTDRSMAEKYVSLNKNALKLYKKFLPGPVTVVSSGKHTLAPGVEAENGTLGIRIPDYEFVLKVIKKLGRPITTTSANASYKPRPYKISDILNNVSGKQKALIDLMLDAGTLPTREPSTVIDTTLDDPIVLRQGEIKIAKTNGVTSRSEDETRNAGKELFQKYEKHLGKRPIIFALEGPMGAGKTQFAKGVGKAAGVRDEIISPTYNIMDEHDGFCHVDAWRLTANEKLDSVGLTKKLEDKNMVVLVEWADRVLASIKEYSDEAVVVWVKISYGKSENERLISWGNV